MRINSSKIKVMSALIPGELPCLMVRPWRMCTNSSTSARCSSQTARAPRSMLEVFDNDSIRRILRVRRRDCVPSVELRRRLCLTSIPTLLVQKRLRWFGHAARRPEDELINVGDELGYHDQGRPRTDLRTASLRPRTIEKGLG